MHGLLVRGGKQRGGANEGCEEVVVRGLRSKRVKIASGLDDI